MSNLKNRISIVIPVYNSAESLPILIERLYQVLKAMDRDYEVIIVDNRGS